MKNYIVMLLICMSLIGCTGKTQYGECVGLMDEHNIELKYSVSVWNAFVAILFSETLVVPVYTLAKQIQCPTGRK